MMNGRLIGNRYEIVEEIGKGGMAIVYKAKCLVLNRYVALKVLRPEFREDKDFINRFKVEAQSAGSLSHPNIVSIYDVGQDGDLDYIVMEYVEGVTLKQYLDAKGVIPWKEAVDYAAQICAGLEHAHKKGIVHKDIKPHNIIITREGTLKITDFGIAKVMSTSTIATGGGAMGSVHYFSPEQARGGYTDAKTDLYSLGVVLYEMVTGKLPFEGDTAVSIAMQHIEKEPVPPKQLNPSIPQSLENVILKAMCKEQAGRYNTATQMIIDLKKVYIGTPVAYEREQIDSGETMYVPPVHSRINEVPEELLSEKQKRANTKKQAVGDKTRNKKKDVLGIVAGVGTGLAVMVILFLVFFNLFGSSGAEVELPDFRGKTVEEAKEMVKNTKLEIIVDREEKSDEIEEGKIISQNPTANKKVKENAKIKVVVSLGGDGSTMPDLTNKRDIDAQTILNNMDLRFTTVREKSDTIPKDYVVRHTPSEGTTVKKGDSVTLYVSTGKDETMVRVPNLIGMTENDAKAKLLDEGLTWGSISYIESSRTRGTVARQSIREGIEVREKTSIDIQLSSGQSATEPPAPTQAPKTSTPTQAPTQAPATEKPIKPVPPNAGE